MKTANFSLCLVALSLWLLGGGALSAQDWPQWRGPARDGKTSGFTAPRAWPANLTQKWTVPVGIGDSSPALVGNRLFAFGREDTNEVLRCLDAASGKTLWRHEYPADHVVTGPAARHPGPRSSPTVADGRLYALGVGGILSCLDAATGRLLWRKQSTEDYLGVAYDFDSSMSPLVVEGKCFVHIGGKGQGAVIAFDLASGEPKWKWTGDAPANSSPVLVTVAGRRQLVTLAAKNLVGLDLADGKLLWQFPFEAAQGNNATPVVDGAMVYCTGLNKGLVAIQITAQGEGFAATPVWTNSQLSARFTAPVLKGGRLYGYTDSSFCVDARTGATLWLDPAKHGNSAALVDAGPVLIATTVSSELVVYAPDDKACTELAKYKVAGTEIWAHPIVAGPRLYVRDRESLALWSWE